MRLVRIATRASKLAIIQARLVAGGLEARGGRIEIVPVSTRGDRTTDRSLVAIGGDGVFVKELEGALLDGRADVAVHSLKDMPTETTRGLRNAAVLEREDPRDMLVARRREHVTLASLPSGAVVGTSSLRRRAMAQLARPGLDLRDIRGNVDTRVRKVLDGEYDAAILALAGLRRADLLSHIDGAPLAIEEMTPAAGQGAICAQCRDDDTETIALLAPLNHAQTALETGVERALLRALGGGCVVPIGVNASVRAGRMTIQAVIAAADGSSAVRRSAHVAADDEVPALAVAERLAAEMLAAGGRVLIEGFRTAMQRGL